MIKLKEIIKSGGGNAKINRFINRYVLSKKEKKDIINEIKNIKSNSSSSGNFSKYAPRYFSIDFNIADEGWKYLLTTDDIDNLIKNSNIFITIGSTYKQIFIEDNIVFISTYPFLFVDGGRKFYFSYTPLYLDERFAESININKYGFLEFENIIEMMPDLVEIVFGKNITLSMNGITEITEEEYYKVD